MALLLITSFIWAFSFGLVKNFLGGVDAALVAFVRLALALLLFLPLWRPRRSPGPLARRLFGIGMVEFGLMYVFYIQSFRFLAAHQVALFTVFTPLYVAIFDDVLKRRFQPLHFWTSLLAVAGTAVIVYSGWGRSRLLAGFFWFRHPTPASPPARSGIAGSPPAGGNGGTAMSSPGCTWAAPRRRRWPCS
jgi:drug/metabolite transporter (DMT)-like permease